jgi:hypothetical protein
VPNICPTTTSDLDMEPAPVTLEMMEVENKRLRVDLDECKKRLFELLYEDDQVSDATIKEEYEHICESIENWIDEVFKEDDFRNKFRSILKVEPKEQKLTSLGLFQVAQDSDGYPMYEMESAEFQWMTWLGSKDTCNYIVISLVIWRYLESRIFNELFPIGTIYDQRLLFKEILELKNDEQDEGVYFDLIMLRDIPLIINRQAQPSELANGDPTP